ncbi:hypothetical protein R6Q59_028341 [Mikania micrantha]
MSICSVVAHQVFDKWSSKDKSQVSVFNYERIARLLVDEGLVEVAVLAIEKMTSIHGMKLSSAIYNAIIHGFVENDRFEDALFHLKVMKDLKMKLHSSIYNGFIKYYRLTYLLALFTNNTLLINFDLIIVDFYS